MSRSKAGWSIAIALIAATLQSGQARADERFYVLIFGSESRPKLLRYTHTWATFVRVIGEGTDPNAYQVYQHTISWLPQTLEVKVLSPFPEPGVNLDLYQTLQFVHSQGESVTMWGPFEMRPEAWNRSLQVRAIIDSGAPRYRAISTARNMLVSDCIHAVAAVDPIFGREHYPLIRIGKPASRYISRQIMQYGAFDQYQTRAEWLIPRLGLDRYPIEIVPPQIIPRRNCGLCRHPD